MANLITNNAELKINCNTLSVTKECLRILGEDFSNLSKTQRITMSTQQAGCNITTAYVPLENTPRGGVNRCKANLMINNAELKI